MTNNEGKILYVETSVSSRTLDILFPWKITKILDLNVTSITVRLHAVKQAPGK